MTSAAHPYRNIQYSNGTTKRGRYGGRRHASSFAFYCGNSSESNKLWLFLLSETQVIIFVWKIDGFRSPVRVWLVAWLSGNERGFTLMPAGSESAHQGTAVFFSSSSLKSPNLKRNQRERASSLGEPGDDSRALGGRGVCMYVWERERD